MASEEAKLKVRGNRPMAGTGRWESRAWVMQRGRAGM